MALVDDGDYEVPIQSSMGRVVQPAEGENKPKGLRKSDRDEDAVRKQMYVDQSAPPGAAPVPGRLPNEYYYNGQKHRLMPFNPEDIVGDMDVKFKHGDLKFLSLLLRGHEPEDHPLVFDKGLWTDVDALLNHFIECRDRRWGVRQLLRAAKADKKGRIRPRGIDVPLREAIGQPLFPVRIRVAQGHSNKLVGDADTDIFLATRFFSLLDDEQAERVGSIKGVTVLPLNQVPKRLYHRTNERGMNGILQNGCIVTAVDTTKKDLPLYAAAEKEATPARVSPSAHFVPSATMRKQQAHLRCQLRSSLLWHRRLWQQRRCPRRRQNPRPLPAPSLRTWPWMTMPPARVSLRMPQEPMMMRVTPQTPVRRKLSLSGRTPVLNARRLWPTGCSSAFAAKLRRLMTLPRQLSFPLRT